MDKYWTIDGKKYYSIMAVENKLNISRYYVVAMAETGLLKTVLVGDKKKTAFLASEIDSISSDADRLREIMMTAKNILANERPSVKKSVPEGYLTIDEMAKTSHVSRTYIDGVIKAGELPCEKIGSRCICKKQDFEAHMKKIKNRDNVPQGYRNMTDVAEMVGRSVSQLSRMVSRKYFKGVYKTLNCTYLDVEEVENYFEGCYRGRRRKGADND